MKEINKVLIANRGEIAVRLINACSAMGIETVAVYSEADRNSLFVDLATEAVFIGASEAKHSYLDADKIIQAAKTCQADAIHPGYGFLSENAEFAEKCAQQNIIFIGPSASLIQQMGSKIEAKKAAIKAHVPVVPGFQKTDATDEELTQAAKDIGTPILIKASAGGGGRGMRLVENLDNFQAELKQAQQEALAAFGDTAVLLEKFIPTSRHVEVQIIADQLGNVVHAFERDCSIQRNHQKVLEEAPAPNLPEEIRQAMLSAAVNLAKEIGYDSLGTVEYIYDTIANQFYFLEMNTRLQVEHPVTEMITGIDLVKTQIRIATGQELSFSQEDIKVHGWAVEARIAAEDPSENYRPDTGDVISYHSPEFEGSRIDSGLREGSVISHYYDSMLAKAICHGSTRNEACRKLDFLLQQYEIDGIYTNMHFLRDLIGLKDFKQATHHTGSIQENWPAGWQKPDISDETYAQAALAYLFNKTDQNKTSSPWTSLGTWRLIENANSFGKSHFFLTAKGAQCKEVILSGRNGKFDITVEGNAVPSVSKVTLDETNLTYEASERRFKIPVQVQRNNILLTGPMGRTTFIIETVDEKLSRSAADAGNSAGLLSANMPGQVVEILVQQGDHVKEGQKLMVLEAMKLLQDIHAPSTGTIDAIHYQQGDSVEGGTILVSITENNE